MSNGGSSMRTIKRQETERYGLLLSYNPDKDGSGERRGWFNKLLAEGENTSKTWKPHDVWIGMPVYIYETHAGVVASAQISIPVSDNGLVIGAIEEEEYPLEIKPPILLGSLRNSGIIARNPPRKFQYLTKDRCNSLDKLIHLQLKLI